MEIRCLPKREVINPAIKMAGLTSLLWPKGGDGDDEPNQDSECDFGEGAEKVAEACA